MKDYIVFDLEWNQSAQGKEGSVESMPFEIIEIGAVKLDSDFQLISEFHQLIRPQVYKQIHFKISEVTHMDMKELETQGELFPDAIREFIEWCGDDCCFCTWGSMDLTELQRNMAYHGIPIPWEKPLLYYDIQKLYSLLYGDGKVKPSLDTAVEEMKIKMDRPFHRALDDAYYTGRVMDMMGMERVSEYVSIDYYRLPENRGEEVYLIFPSYSKYVSRVFESKEDAIGDKLVSDMICYRCKRMLRKKIRWFTPNQRHYFGLACCPEHGYLRGKIRMKKAENGGIYAVKTLKLVDDEAAQLLYQRRDEAKQKRNEKNKLRRTSKKKALHG